MRRHLDHLTGVLATAFLAVGLVLGVPVLVPAGSTADAAPGRCEPGTGVTVVVDFGGLGGGVPIGCDPSGGGKPASQVVPAAGFTVTYVNGQPFVCRVDGKPSAEQESCQRTPPTDAYWGLFWSDGTSGAWTYSSQGIASLKVPDGGSIGLRWQDGGDREQPGAAPTVAAEAKPTPSPKPSAGATPEPSARPTAKPEGSRSPAAPSASAAATTVPGATADGAPGSAEPTPRDKPTRRERTPRPDESPSAQATVSADPTQTPADAEGDLTDAAEVAATDDGDGSGLTWLAAAVVLALAASVAVVAARRRRA